MFVYTYYNKDEIYELYPSFLAYSLKCWKNRRRIGIWTKQTTQVHCAPYVNACRKVNVKIWGRMNLQGRLHKNWGYWSEYDCCDQYLCSLFDKDCCNGTSSSGEDGCRDSADQTECICFTDLCNCSRQITQLSLYNVMITLFFFRFTFINVISYHVKCILYKFV